MVYELLWDFFVLNNSTSGFYFFFEMCKHIVRGHFPQSISHMFVASQLLALEKQTKGVWPIMIREVIYQLITHTLAI
jgi:hypothetical protein